METKGVAGSLPAAPVLGPERETALREVSIKLEATFLAEMLKSSGFDGETNSFGGGVGEEQFQSFLREAQALKMSQGGGIGLAENIFQSLKERG